MLDSMLGTTITLEYMVAVMEVMEVMEVMADISHFIDDWQNEKVTILVSKIY